MKRLTFCIPCLALIAAVALRLGAETMPPLPEGAFTYAVIPDTQAYDGEGRTTKNGRKPGVGPTKNRKLDAIVDWLVANAKKENIRFVSHTGDITDMNNDPQWRFASNAMARLDGVLPYAISPGNHDMKSSGDTSFFQRYFPASRFAGNSWYVETFPGYTNSAGLFTSGNNANSVCTFDGGAAAKGDRFVVVTLECNAPDPVLKWAEKVVERHPDSHVIVSTHMDLGAIDRKNARKIHNETSALPKEERAKYEPDLSLLGRMEWHKCHGKDGNAGKAIWEKFTSRLKNAFLVVSGDQGMIKITRVDGKGVHGNMVYSLMQDTGGGYIRIFRFVPSEKVVRCYTIDPGKGGELVHSCGVWRDDLWFNFDLPYPGTEGEKPAPPKMGAEAAPCKAAANAAAKPAAAKTVDAYIPPERGKTVECAAIPADDPIAMRKLEWKGMGNVRDLGGLPGRDGRRVKKGRIYRSDGLNNNAQYRVPGSKTQILPKSEWKGPGATRIKPEAAKHVVETLGVKTDLDLRTDAETYLMTGSPLGDKVRWVHISSSEYGGLMKGKGREAFIKDFKVFLDEANYPIVFHCIAGADRTGSLACILNGLLGVDADLLHRDWQFTWMGRKKPHQAPEKLWDSLMKGLSTFEGATLNEKIEKYVLSCGFTQEDIAKFRSMMLE